MSSADLVTCLCKNCNSLLCVSTNNWTEITSSYATYDIPHLFSHPGLEQTGTLRPGSKDSELSGCTVQPLHCMKCRESMGVKCVGVVSDKEMHRDRCFLKLGKLHLKNLAGTTVEADIKVKNSLTSDPKAPAPVSHTKRQTWAAERANGHTGSVGTDSEQLQQQDEITHVIKRQEGDIIVILQNLQALQEEMRDFQKQMTAFRTDVDDIRARRDEGPIQEVTEDIDMLTDTISNVSGRLGEVDSLKLEVKMMQSRIKRLEDEKRGPQKSLATPLTPSSAPNRVRTVPSYENASNKRPGSSDATSTTRLAAPGPTFDTVQERARAVSAQPDHTHHPTVNSAPVNSQAASGQSESGISRSPNLAIMPPPVRDTRSASDRARNPRTQSNLHNAISALNESTIEFPTVLEESDEDYDEQNELSPGPEDETSAHRQGRQSLPNLIASGATADDRESNRNSKKRRRTTSHALDRDAPSPHPDDPAYQSVWAPVPAESESRTPTSHQRNAHGLIIKPNGEIDKRSLRFLGKSNSKRRLNKDALRDAEGYLLRPDGTRNPRSVGIINGMRKMEREASQANELSEPS